MSFDSTSISVAATATLIAEGRGKAGPQGVSDVAVAIYNAGAATVYLGGSLVTVAAGAHAGFPLTAGSTAMLGDLGADDSVYGIVTSGSNEVRVMTLG